MKNKDIDPEMVAVLLEFQPRIHEMAIQAGMNSTEFFRNILSDELDTNIPFFKELIKVFIEKYKSTEDPILREIIVETQTAVQKV